MRASGSPKLVLKEYMDESESISAITTARLVLSRIWLIHTSVEAQRTCRSTGYKDYSRISTKPLRFRLAQVSLEVPALKWHHPKVYRMSY